MSLLRDIIKARSISFVTISLLGSSIDDEGFLNDTC